MVGTRERRDLAPRQAIVASEDHRFFKHSGVDIRGLLRAIGSLGKAGGGSTITQQLVKNLVLSQDRTLSRKAAEILLSLRVEKRLTKEELLEAYLNNVYWAGSVHFTPIRVKIPPSIRLRFSYHAPPAPERTS